MRRKNRKLLVAITFVSVFVIALTILENNLEMYSRLFAPHPAGPCFLAEMDPFEPSRMAIAIKKYKSNGFTPKCSPNPRFTTNTKYLVRLKPENEFWKDANCYYSSYTRKPVSDGVFQYTDVEFMQITSNSTEIPEEYTFIRVQCRSTNNSETLLYDDLFHFIRIIPEVEERILAWEKKDEGDKRVSIVILGIDSVARMNFLRYMPKVEQYITNNISESSITIGLEAFNKVGANSIHNVNPLLMGIAYSDLSSCWKKQSTQSALIECPFIWKEYAARGYRTSFAEDDVTFRHNFWKFEAFGRFENAQTGSTDYDLQPLADRWLQRIEGIEGLNQTGQYARMCWGYKQKFQYLLDNILQIFETLGDRPLFQYTWETYLTHDISRMSSYADDMLIPFFETMKEKKYLQDTVFILTADHGLFKGENRNNPPPTPQEFVEERTPVIYFILPKWLEEKFPTAVQNFRENSKRLTTHFDAHQTLKDLLDLTSLEESRLSKRQDQSYSEQKGISLFLPIPKNRTCETAGIPDSHCVCWYKKSVRKDENVFEAAQVVVHWLNSNEQRVISQCSHLRLSKVIEAVTKFPFNPEMDLIDDEGMRKINMYPELDLIFQVQPTEEIYKARVVKVETGWEVEGDVVNLNNASDQC